ncbi:MAG: hypothetical protein AB7E32_10925 [Desulfovibrio sp.]
MLQQIKCKVSMCYVPCGGKICRTVSGIRSFPCFTGANIRKGVNQNAGQGGNREEQTEGSGRYETQRQLITETSLGDKKEKA